jgi:LAS superfamily LD-carboxypeptidase LdcB
MGVITSGRRVLDSDALTGHSQLHTIDVTEYGCRLHPVTAAALQQLRAAAAADNIDLFPVSGFRDFGQQLRIWNAKFRGERPLLDRQGAPLDALQMPAAARVTAILLWSALPGASRHHWGTDFDVIDRRCLAPGATAQLTPAEFAPAGCFSVLNQWLAAHAADFGFFRPYDRDRGGVQPEPWHLSFAPLATAALRALSCELLATALAAAALEGAEVVVPQLPELHRRYVLGVAAPSARACAAARLATAD